MELGFTYPCANCSQQLIDLLRREDKRDKMPLLKGRNIFKRVFFKIPLAN
jgi:hypothetical protein